MENDRILHIERYQEICQSLPKKSTGDGDHPSDFDTLSNTEQDALFYWIEHTIHRAKRFDNRTTYGIKHDFEYEGFYISNGQMKGAMLLLGYEVEDISELNWTFRIRRAWRRTSTDRKTYHIEESYYSIAGFDKEYAKLLMAAGHLS